jgi:hypothetical protein
MKIEHHDSFRTEHANLIFYKKRSETLYVSISHTEVETPGFHQYIWVYILWRVGVGAETGRLGAGLGMRWRGRLRVGGRTDQLLCVLTVVCLQLPES